MFDGSMIVFARKNANGKKLEKAIKQAQSRSGNVSPLCVRVCRVCMSKDSVRRTVSRVSKRFRSA